MRRRHSRNTREYMILRNGSILIFIVIFILIGTGYALLSTKVEIQGKATLIAGEKPIEPGLSVASLKTVNNWGQGRIMSITITNNDSYYDDWEISFEVPEETTDVLVHTSYIYGSVNTFDGNKVTIKMNKISEDGSINWSAPWELNDKKEIQIQFTFSTIVDNVSFKNVILNNKLIASELTEIIDTPVENEDVSIDTTDNTASTNIVEGNNNVIDDVENDLQNNVMENENVMQENIIQNGANIDTANLVSQNNIE